MPRLTFLEPSNLAALPGWVNTSRLEGEWADDALQVLRWYRRLLDIIATIATASDRHTPPEEQPLHLVELANEPALVVEGVPHPHAALVVWHPDGLEVATELRRVLACLDDERGQELRSVGPTTRVRLRAPLAGPFVAFIHWNGWVLVSASPEVPRGYREPGQTLVIRTLPDLDALFQPPTRWKRPSEPILPCTILTLRPRQYTFLEARALASALAKAALWQGWEPVQYREALTFQSTHHSIQFSPSEPLRARLNDCAPEKLRREVEQIGYDSILLLHVILTYTITAGSVVLSLDQLVRAVGWNPRSAEDRAKMRDRLWSWLLVIGSCEVHGNRTKRESYDTNLAIQEPLVEVQVTGSVTGGTPEQVTVKPSDWLKRASEEVSRLPYYPDLEPILAIPGGKAAGAWARSIGLALQQRWRERTARATVSFEFSRRELLTLFPPHTPSIPEVQENKNASRAKQYWNGAIQILKDARVIGEYRELTPPPKGRQGWFEDWLDQRLLINPSDEARQALSLIRKGAPSGGGRKKRPSRAAPHHS